MNRSPRSGFALIDLVATVFAVALLTAIGVHWVAHARNQAKATGCRNNLRQLGVALGQYTETHGTLPVVSLAGPGLVISHSPLALLLPYLPETVDVPYDAALLWYEQRADVASRTIRIFRCPASEHRDPVDSPQARKTKCPLGTRLGTTDYVVCKGPKNAWCMERGVSRLPLKKRGAFEIGCPVRPTDMADGLGNTIVMGEGTGGSEWPISARSRFPSIVRETESDQSPQSPSAVNFWCWPFLNTTVDQARTHVVATSLFGTTATKLNHRPVMETLVDLETLEKCAPDDGRASRDSVSGFRSEHAGGGYFLFADGSSHFCNQEVDTDVYQALSTIAGSESVQYVN